MSVSFIDIAADLAEERQNLTFPTPGALATYIDPRRRSTPMLDLLDRELLAIADRSTPRLAWSCAPQEGKSQAISRAFPLWTLLNNPDTRIGIASYEHGIARRWGRQIRNDIVSHPELGLAIRPDSSAAHEWQLSGHDGGVYCVGVGGALTGRPLDCVGSDTLIESEYGQLTAAEAFDRGITRILAYDHATGRSVWRDVEATRRITSRRVIEITTMAGRTITCTPDHRVYTSTGYVAAGHLRGGETLVAIVDAGGCDEQPAAEPHHAVYDLPCRAPQVEEDTVALVHDRGHDTITVYDFQVADTRNFFGNGILVHNCLIVDDPVKGRAEADSRTYRDQARDWWQETAVTRLAPNAPSIILMTRWHQDDLLGWLVDTDHTWRYVNIPTEAEDNDPLGREPGEWLQSARRRTPEQWEEIRRRVGSRAWAALYQGHPAPAEGAIFKREWWRTYDVPRAYQQSDGAWHFPGAAKLIQSWDLAFKDTDGSDFVVGQVWAKIGAECWLLDQIRARMNFPATCQAIRNLSWKWPQTTAKYIEDKANGPAVIAQLRREIPGLIAIEPKDSKLARAHTVTPLIEAGNIALPSAQLAPWMGDWLEEVSAFPNATHDDQVDAMTQALHQLMLDRGSVDTFMSELMQGRSQGE